MWSRGCGVGVGCEHWRRGGGFGCDGDGVLARGAVVVRGAQQTELGLKEEQEEEQEEEHEQEEKEEHEQ